MMEEWGIKDNTRLLMIRGYSLNTLKLFYKEDVL